MIDSVQMRTQCFMVTSLLLNARVLRSGGCCSQGGCAGVCSSRIMPLYHQTRYIATVCAARRYLNNTAFIVRDSSPAVTRMK